jgi:hypothetical protein
MRGGFLKSRDKRAVVFLSLQEILFGRKIGRPKKQNGRCDMQSKVQIDQALPQPGSLASAGHANNKLDRPLRAKSQVSF